MTRKLLIVPWFGDLPPWARHWNRNVETLRKDGYTVALMRHLPTFARLCRERLGVECSVVAGEGKVHDYRAAFGVLYADWLNGYDFWGHTDLDCVYGRVQDWVTEEFLDGVDIHANHVDYVCGPWTLYRNRPMVNELFMQHPDWKAILEHPDTTGWVEKGYTQIVDEYHAAGELDRRYTMWQTKNLDSFDRCRLLPDGRLLEGVEERMMLHFRRTKEYPAGCIL